MVCGGDNRSIQVQNVVFSDWENAKRGYYLRIEEGEVHHLHEDLLLSPADYTYAKELIEGKIDSVVTDTTEWSAPANFGGYLNLGFPYGELDCNDDLADLPPGFSGGLYVDVQSEYGTWEDFAKFRQGDVQFGHVLVFPYNDGCSVFIQRNTRLPAYVYVGYAYSALSLTWDGTAVFADGHTVHYRHEKRLHMAGSSGHSPPSGMTDDYTPQYPDLRFAIEYPEGHTYYNYSGYWNEVSDNRKLYYASAKNSDLVFDETATLTQTQSYLNFPFAVSGHPGWSFPSVGIDPELCFGKHAWYVEISLIEFWPWFDSLVALNESFGGDAFYFQQWGPFENGVGMPYQPIYNTTDNHYPVFDSAEWLYAANLQFHSVFTGWA